MGNAGAEEDQDLQQLHRGRGEQEGRIRVQSGGFYWGQRRAGGGPVGHWAKGDTEKQASRVED